MLAAFIIKLINSVVLMILFYKFIKGHVIHIAHLLVNKLSCDHYNSLEKTRGTVELILITISHLFFCLSIMYWMDWKPVLFFDFQWIQLLYGFFIGLGTLCCSTLISQLALLLIQQNSIKYRTTSLEAWLTLARGGWMRHYLYSLNSLPLWLALIIIFCQLSAEEIFFRSILIHYFIPHGQWLAIVVSTVLFSFMQIFFMPDKINAMFPVIGATIMGLVHGLLYTLIPNLIPLIIAHMVFFLLAL